MLTTKILIDTITSMFPSSDITKQPITNLLDEENYNMFTMEGFVGMVNHQELFKRIYTLRQFKIFYDHKDIQLEQGNVLTYIIPLKMYQVFDTVENYKMHIKHISNFPICHNIGVYQLTLISEQHKFIIQLMKSPNSDEMVKKLTSLPFMSGNYRVKYDELNIQIMYEDRVVRDQNEEQALFNLIKMQVQDCDISIPIYYNFIKNNISGLYMSKYTTDNPETVNRITTPGTDEIVRRLYEIEKHLSSIKCYSITINNNINSNNNIVNSTVAGFNIGSQKSNDVEKWLIDNPPDENFTTKQQYYDYYISATGSTMKYNTWCKAASKIYQIKRNKNIRRFVSVLVNKDTN